MGIMSCLKFFWCLYAIRQSLSGIVHFCDAASDCQPHHFLPTPSMQQIHYTG